MKVLAKTGNMSREDWLKLRTLGIGGSDASVIAGLNPYRSVFQLWKEKTGQLEPSLEENDFTHFGNVMEPIIKKEFTERTGYKVRARKMMLQHDEYPFMLADLDGVVNIDGEMCIFEAKTASAYKQEVWEKGVPIEYVYQVQHYMAVTGYKRAFVAAIIGGNTFCYYEVPRDEALIAEIIAMEKYFWEVNVLGMVEPAADGSKATTEYLNTEYIDALDNVVELPQDALAIFAEYDDVTMQLKELETKKDALCNQMKSYLKESEYGFVGDRRISWKQVVSTRFDKKRLEAEQPEIYKDFLIQSKYRRLSVA